MLVGNNGLGSGGGVEDFGPYSPVALGQPNNMPIAGSPLESLETLEPITGVKEWGQLEERVDVSIEREESNYTPLVEEGLEGDSSDKWREVGERLTPTELGESAADTV